jgi:DNA-binding NarL/FixJ family response regulator
MKAPRPKRTHVSKRIYVSVLESDHVRTVGLQAVFTDEPDIDIRAGTVESVLHSRHQELVLMTMDRGPSFSAAMSTLKTLRPSIRIIVTGPGRDDEDILRAITAGAKGYVPTEAPSDVLKKAIREVHAGSVWIPRRVVASFIERSTARPHPPRIVPNFSPRQLEVLRLVVTGCSNREIAQDLGIIEQTVKWHVAQLLHKIGVPNRTALSMHALTRSLLGQRE